MHIAEQAAKNLKQEDPFYAQKHALRALRKFQRNEEVDFRSHGFGERSSSDQARSKFKRRLDDSTGSPEISREELDCSLPYITSQIQKQIPLESVKSLLHG